MRAVAGGRGVRAGAILPFKSPIGECAMESLNIQLFMPLNAGEGVRRETIYIVTAIAVELLDFVPLPVAAAWLWWTPCKRRRSRC